MSQIREYLERIQDLVDDLEAKLAPHREKCNARILAAEAAYTKAVSEPAPGAAYIASRDDGSGVMVTLASYMQKWHEKDALKACEAECRSAESDYHTAVYPIQQAHERLVQERMSNA